MFLGIAKPFFQQKDFLPDYYLDDFNLMDYGQQDKEFTNIYDSDTRIERYLNADLPKLPPGFQMAGRGEKTRDICGKYTGTRGTKQNPLSTFDPMFKTCNKLSCPICVRKACTTKAQAITEKIKTYIWYMVTEGVRFPNLRPKHYTFNPNYVDKFGVYHENFTPNFDSNKTYHKSIKDFIAKYISPYLKASVVFYHHHRFKDITKLNLKVSGHFHVIGFGFMPEYEVFKKKFGFVYTNAGYLNTTFDIFKVARYELTHVIFPQKFITRKTVRTESQMDYLRRQNEWLNFLHIDTKPIEKINKTRSLYSYPAYFYDGFLSPYKIRYVKCEKKNRTPNGLKKVKFWKPMRDVDTNDKIYEYIDGFLIRVLDTSGRWKYYTPAEAIEKGIIVNKSMQIKFFNNRLKTGKLFKINSSLNWILIKDFKIKDSIF